MFTAHVSSFKNELQPQSNYKQNSDGISTGVNKWNRTDIQKQMQVYTELNIWRMRNFSLVGKRISY